MANLSIHKCQHETHNICCCAFFGAMVWLCLVLDFCLSLTRSVCFLHLCVAQLHAFAIGKSSTPTYLNIGVDCLVFYAYSYCCAKNRHTHIHIVDLCSNFVHLYVCFLDVFFYSIFPKMCFSYSRFHFHFPNSYCASTLFSTTSPRPIKRQRLMTPQARGNLVVNNKVNLPQQQIILPTSPILNGNSLQNNSIASAVPASMHLNGGSNGNGNCSAITTGSSIGDQISTVYHINGQPNILGPFKVYSK